MDATDEYIKYMKDIYKNIDPYLPPKDQWTPVEECIAKPADLFDIPNQEAEQLQYKALKYQFKNQYENNHIYHDFCKQENISPGDINGPQDLLKIPILPDGFFKQYPEGKEFATWLANIFTGELPQIKIKQKNPSYDQVLDAFNEVGLTVAFSSGTSGRHTFIPRDKKTFNLSQYTLAKGAAAMMYPFLQYDSYGYMLMPNPTKVNIWAGRNLEVYTKVVKHMEYAIDRAITTDIIQATMGGAGGLKAKIIRKASKKTSQKMKDDMIRWFDHHHNTDNKITLMGAPWILWFALEYAESKGKTYDFGEQGFIITGGGWKIHEQKRVTAKDFRKRIEELLGIPPNQVLDLYNMVECNGWFTQCPEGHHLHINNSYIKPIILDEDNQPIDGFDEAGRLAFLDAAAYSYPGFITTGDKVRLLEHCPSCGRSGPVLAPEVDRVKGADVRGCAEEMRRMMTKDLGR